MILGFTGTSESMTQRQRATVNYLFRELQLTELHHGDCVGADAQAHRLAMNLGASIVIHPPSSSKARAFCSVVDAESGGPFRITIHKPYAYLTRNRHIVRDGADGLIAAPRQAQQPASLRGEGTWTTVGYARQARRRIWIVLPDGTFREEQP